MPAPGLCQTGFRIPAVEAAKGSRDGFQPGQQAQVLTTPCPSQNAHLAPSQTYC